MTVLILGRTGQVARALRARLPEAVVAGRDQADFDHPDMVAAAIAATRPRIIINAAAYTAVDAAEEDRERAFLVNATSVGAIGTAARAMGALVVHFSTDYVFDGAGETPFAETDATAPLSVYGASKLAGEAALADSGAQHLTLRVSWVYDTSGKNFPLTILRLARERSSLRVVADQVGSPSSAAFIADHAVLAMRQVADGRASSGLYHLAPAGAVSWHGFAQAVVTEAQRRGARLACNPADIAAISTADYPTRAKRPHNSRLDTRKFRTTFGLDLPEWQAGLGNFFDVLQQEGQL